MAQQRSPAQDERGDFYRGDLTRGPIATRLAFFAIPVLGSNVLQSVNGTINSIWVGRFLGEAALTATSNANLVLFLLLGAVFGIGMAATILVAQAIGANDLLRAKQVIGTSATFFLAMSAFLAIGGYLSSETILRLLGTPPDAGPLAEAYLRIVFIALPAMNLFSFVMTVLRGAGDSRTPFYFMALAVVLCVALNPLLILGLGPLPELGIRGAAAAMLISQTVSVVAIIALLYSRKHPLRLVGTDLGYLRPDPRLLCTIVGKGVPMGLQMIVISISALLLMGLVNGFGSHTAAAYGIAAQLWTFVQMPALAIGAAVSSMAAQNVGAGRWDRIGRIAGAGVAFNLLLTGLLVALLYLFDRSVVGIFLGSDSLAVETAVHINALAVWSFVLFGITNVLFGTVRATGAVVPPLLILAFSLLVVRTSFAYGLQDLLGAEAIWWSFPVGAITSLVLATLYYRKGNWRQVRMGEPRPASGEPPVAGFGLPRERAEARL